MLEHREEKNNHYSLTESSHWNENPKQNKTIKKANK